MSEGAREVVIEGVRRGKGGGSEEGKRKRKDLTLQYRTSSHVRRESRMCEGTIWVSG